MRSLIQNPGSALLPFVLLACAAPRGSEDYAEIGDTEDLVVELERAEEVAALDAVSDSIRDRIDESEARLDRFLVMHPNDVPALVTAARLDRLKWTLAGTAFDAGRSLTEPRQQAAEAIGHLDRALQRSPQLPGLWYWKSRVLGSRYPVEREGVLLREPADLEGAIDSARRAVASERSGIDHALWLASLLVETGRDDEAADVLRSSGNGWHPALQLLADLERLPVPPGAVRSPEDGYARGRQQLERRRIPDHPQFRVRSWIVPASAAEVESAWSERISGFRLLPAERLEQESATILPHVQYLTETADGLAPIASLAQLPERPPEAGIVLDVIEIRRRSPDAPYRTPGGRIVPVEFGATFCLVDAIDFRR